MEPSSSDAIAIERGVLGGVLRGWTSARGMTLRRNGRRWARVSGRPGPGWWRARLVASAAFTAAAAGLVALFAALDVAAGAYALFGLVVGAFRLASALLEWLGPGWNHFVSDAEGAPILLMTPGARRRGATVWEVTDADGAALGTVVLRAARDRLFRLGPSSPIGWLEPADGAVIEARRQSWLTPGWTFQRGDSWAGHVTPSALGVEELHVAHGLDPRLFLAAAIVGRTE